MSIFYSWLCVNSACVFSINSRREKLVNDVKQLVFWFYASRGQIAGVANGDMLYSQVITCSKYAMLYQITPISYIMLLLIQFPLQKSFPFKLQKTASHSLITHNFTFPTCFSSFSCFSNLRTHLCSSFLHVVETRSFIPDRLKKSECNVDSQLLGTKS